MNLALHASRPQGLDVSEIEAALRQSLAGRAVKKALILPPDFTRHHSNAGLLTCLYDRILQESGAQVDILPALGTHVPVSREQAAVMFPGIAYDRLIPHSWRNDVVRVGVVPGDYIASITDGLWNEPITVEVNRLLLDPGYDLILSPGQVVPHEVIGMSNHSKNIFVGVGGSDMINKSHMVGAVYGMERMMGRDHTPVRKIFDYALEHFLGHLPLLFALTVTTAPGGKIQTHGLFIGDTRECLESAIALAQEKNLDMLDRPIQKCVVYLDPAEFQSTWLGNKSVYRTRMAIADGGQLIILAPGVERFGEDAAVDGLIRKYGYRGRLATLEAFKANDDLRANMSAAAHLIHGSSDGRFSITYAVKQISRREIESVGFASADYDTMAQKYNPATLKPGYNTVDGEEIYYIPNPALGLWVDKKRFTEESNAIS